MSAKSPVPRLGRGLAALIDPTGPPFAEHPAHGAIRPIPIEMLDPGPHQPRGKLRPEALDELVESIRARGILQPVLARPRPGSPGRYEIVAGERRWRAAQRAGLHEVPVLVRELSDLDAMSAALVENLQRQDLNAVEEAEGYQRLVVEFKLTQDAIAAAVGKSRSHVANTMRLLNLPNSVQNDLRAGTLSAGHARALLAHPEPAKAALVVISRGLNVRQTEALAGAGAERHGTDRRSRRAETDPDIVALERRLADALGAPVRIESRGRRGAVTIRYDDLDQLEAIIARLTA